jgi:L-threonine kinase
MRKVIVRVPGSCGELLQGTWRGKPLLVTCPIDRYSEVVIELGEPSPLLPKAQKMAELASDFYGVSLEGLRISLTSQLPQGKGMSSSSADIAAVGAGIASWGRKWPERIELLELCHQIEPTDGTFFEGILYLDHLQGDYLCTLPGPPNLQIQIFDCGGEVDTLSFNQRSDLDELNLQKAEEVEKAFAMLREALAEKDSQKLAQASTRSALAHQLILPKPNLEEINQWVIEQGALGIVIAHSGTVIGILWPEEICGKKLEIVRQNLPCKWKNYSYYDQVTLISGGIWIEEIDD